MAPYNTVRGTVYNIRSKTSQMPPISSKLARPQRKGLRSLLSATSVWVLYRPLLITTPEDAGGRAYGL